MHTSRENVVHAKVYDNFDELETFQQDWDSFVESVSGDILLTYDWCRIWWKYYGDKRKLQVFIFLCDNKLVGIIPLFFERLWLGPLFIRAAKILGSDSTGDQLSVPIQSKRLRAVIQKFFELLSENDWDILHIGPIAGMYKNYDDLRSACGEIFDRSHLVLSKTKGEQTYFKLTDTWDDYLAGLHRKERNKIRRHHRLVLKAAGDKRATVSADCASISNFDKIFSGFVQMHQEHWRKLNMLGHFGDWPCAQEFHRELAKAQLQRNRLRLIQITLGEWCLGYKYGYIFGNNYFDFLDVRCDRKELAGVGLGRVIYSEMIKKAIKEKAKWIDSMQGKYKHKLEMGGKLFPVRSICVIPKNFTTVILVSLFRFFARLLNLSYYRIWYNTIAPKLPLERKGLWKIWIRTSNLS